MIGEPRDLAILKALTAHLEGITPGNGYEFDLQGKVARGRVRFGRDDELPMLSLLEAPQTEDGNLLATASENRMRVQHRWSILLQGWAVNDTGNPSDPAYVLKAACEHRLSRIVDINNSSGRPVDSEAYLLGKTISGLQIGPGLVSPPREGISDTAFFYLPLVIERVSNASNPYV